MFIFLKKIELLDNKNFIVGEQHKKCLRELSEILHMIKFNVK